MILPTEMSVHPVFGRFALSSELLIALGVVTSSEDYGLVFPFVILFGKLFDIVFAVRNANSFGVELSSQSLWRLSDFTAAKNGVVFLRKPSFFVLLGLV